MNHLNCELFQNFWLSIVNIRLFQRVGQERHTLQHLSLTFQSASEDQISEWNILCIELDDKLCNDDLAESLTLHGFKLNNHVLFQHLLILKILATLCCPKLHLIFYNLACTLNIQDTNVIVGLKS